MRSAGAKWLGLDGQLIAAQQEVIDGLRQRLVSVETDSQGDTLPVQRLRIAKDEELAQLRASHGAELDALKARIVQLGNTAKTSESSSKRLSDELAAERLGRSSDQKQASSLLDLTKQAQQQELTAQADRFAEELKASHAAADARFERSIRPLSGEKQQETSEAKESIRQNAKTPALTMYQASLDNVQAEIDELRLQLNDKDTRSTELTKAGASQQDAEEVVDQLIQTLLRDQDGYLELIATYETDLAEVEGRARRYRSQRNTAVDCATRAIASIQMRDRLAGVPPPSDAQGPQ
ncbi:hypothetical protein LTR85_004230 [Meristemomyces frigidus]|nr:hypothetical protein LTR85_004230 [Meristemomyces frigidus]